MDGVSGELNAFLDYVAGKHSEDSFVKKLEEAVKEAKKNREWRHEYMTLRKATDSLSLAYRCIEDGSG